MDNTFLCAEAISKKYGKVNALKEVSFSLERGEILGLFGRNGSGKSTLLDIVALATESESGKIIIDGEEVGSKRTSFRRRIGYVPQEIALFEELTVKENLLCWSRLPGKKAKQRADEIAERLNLNEFYGKRVSALSGGMKRRVNLAVALLCEPELLVLDEPFAGVDTDNTEIIERVLRELADSGMGIIVSGHSPEQLVPLVDKVLVLSYGERIYFDEKAEFLCEAGESGAGILMRKVISGADK